jgi:fatty-acyl-CoA synthase
MDMLLSVLRRRAAQTPDRLWATCDDGTLTYGQSLSEAARWAHLFRAHRASSCDVILLALPNGVALLGALFGAHLAGCVPALAPPQRRETAEEFSDRLAVRARVVSARMIVVPDAACDLAQRGAHGIVLDPQSRSDDGDDTGHVPKSTDIGLIQFTSGTSGRAKGIPLTQGALSYQAEALTTGLAVDPAWDHSLSWLPLYHDMGLFGFVLAPLFSGTPTTILATERFVRQPLAWLNAITERRATITAAPPTAYAVAARMAARRTNSPIDLSSLRVALTGAEVVLPSHIAQITAQLAPFGLRSDALLPAYGLAEVGVVATLSRPATPPQLFPVGAKIDQAAQPEVGQSVPVHAVGCGKPIPGTDIAVFGGTTRLKDGEIGSIALRSAFRATGYMTKDRQMNMRTVGPDWMLTGDFGFLKDGALCVLGREDDLIVSGGGRFIPEEIEDVALDVGGPGVTLAVAVAHPSSTGQSAMDVILLLFSPFRDHSKRDALAMNIRQALVRRDLPVQRIEFLSDRRPLSSSNGKRSRAAYRALLAAGKI